MSAVARSRAPLEVDVGRMEVVFGGRRVDARLSTREVEVLAYLLDRAERVCTREELGQRFWGEHYDPTAVYKFMSRVKTKLPG